MGLLVENIEILSVAMLNMQDIYAYITANNLKRKQNISVSSLFCFPLISFIPKERGVIIEAILLSVFFIYILLFNIIMDFLSNLNSNKQKILNMLYTYLIS